MSVFDTIRDVASSAIEAGARQVVAALGDSAPAPAPAPAPPAPAPGIVGALDALEKARPKAKPKRPLTGLSDNRQGLGRLEGIFTDPDMRLHSAGGIGEYAQRPTGMNWDILRRMAKAPPVVAVSNVMQSGLAEFCTPQPNAHLPGMMASMRGKGPKYMPTRAERAELDRVEQFMFHCGHVGDSSDLVNRQTLESAIRAGFMDSFRFDQFCMQIEPKAGWSPGGKFVPHRFYVWPGHTMRLALPPEDGSRISDSDKAAIRYVQVNLHDEVVGEFTGQQMMFGVLNPSPDIENAGYGCSALEQLVDVLTGWLYGYGYNKSYFKQGANVRGILHFDAEPPVKQQRRFERYFHALVMGVGNAHKVPIAWGGKANWLSLGQTNRDMEFNQWMDFLTKLLCAICGMDPAEINFTFGNSGQTASIGGQASAAEKIEASRNRWLRPRVRALFDWLNRWLVWQLNPDVVLVPTGIDVRSEEAQHERLMKLVSNTHTVDEVRAMMGDDPMKKADPKELPGQVILNSVWQQATAAAPEEGPGGPEGPGGEEEPPAEDVDEAKAAMFGGAKGGDKGKPEGEAEGDGEAGGEAEAAVEGAAPVFDKKLLKARGPRDTVAGSVTINGPQVGHQHQEEEKAP